MADDKSTDTSTNEGTSTNEADLDSDDVFNDVDVSEEIEKADKEEAATAATEDAEPEAEESEEDEESEDTESDEPDEDSEAADTTAEPTEAQRAEAARRDYQEREAKRKALEAAKSEAQQEYLDQAEDNRDLALRQLQIDAYNNRVEGNTNKLQNGIDKAVATIDLFQTGTPEQKEALLEAIDDFEAYHIAKDANGDPIEVSGDVYQYLLKKSESIKRLAGVGARQQEKNKSAQKQRTLATPSRTPKSGKKDPGLDAFDEEANREW